jgi:uncharacterized protein (DUF2062 family)
MIRKLRLRLERYFLYHLIALFRIRDRSERIARGFAVGLIVNFFPTFGFGVVISPAVARICGGHIAAGFAGGALLTFSWPFLFYLNMRMGSRFFRSPIPIDELEDVTERSIGALQWGQTFMAGALVNSLLVGGSVYLVLRLAYARVRPRALAWFRSHSAEHRRRYGSARLKAGADGKGDVDAAISR